MRDVWEPSQYERFRDERSQPFFDLLSLVAPRADGRVIDLGCGTGELTRHLHRHVQASETVGIDESESMLAKARAYEGQGLRFEHKDIATWEPREKFDVVFSNAALHWLPDHESLLGRLASALAPGGQLAVQVPANFDHPSHATARQVAQEAPFRQALGGFGGAPSVLLPERYAMILHRLHLSRLHVRLQVYIHVLDGPAEVVSWVRGTLLTDYERRLEPEVFERFLERYEALLLDRIGDERPYAYTFKRVLLRGVARGAGEGLSSA